MTEKRQHAERRSAERRGRRAEFWAAWWLRAKGFRVVASRVRTPVGEIDLVVRRGRLLVLVEVKARALRASGLEAIGAGQRRRIARAGDWFLGSRPALQTLDLRYDVVVVTPWQRPLHIPDAWRPATR